MKKTILFVFLFSHLLFAATQTIEGSMSTFLIPGEIRYISTDLRLTNEFSFNPEPACAGDSVTVTPEIDTAWPTSTSKLDVLSNYPACFSFPDDCPADPVSYSSININRRVKWVSDDDYDYILSIPGFALEGEAPMMDTFNAQRVDYDQTLDKLGPEYENARGDVGLYCKGKVETIVRDPSNGVMATDESDVYDIDTVQFTPDEAGRYSITTRLKDVSCLGGVRIYPTQSGTKYFTIYVMNEESLDAGLLEETDYIDVGAGDGASLIITGSIPGANFDMEPSSARGMLFSVRNDGEVTVKTTGVRSTNPRFGVSPTLGVENGFNDDIDAGRTDTLWVTLTSPADLGDSEVVDICFQYESQEPMCGGSSEGEVCKRFSISSEAQACSACTILIDPGVNDVVLDAPAEIGCGIRCTNDRGTSIQCENTQWELTPGLGEITSSSNTRATADIDGGPLVGDISADVNGECQCDAGIETTFFSMDSCDVLPPSAEFDEAAEARFDLECEVNNATVPCPAGMTFWTLTSSLGDIINADNTGADVNITGEGDGYLIATIGGVFSCHSNITSNATGGNGNDTPGETYGGYGCEVFPNEGWMHPGEGFTYTVWCYKDEDREEGLGRCHGIGNVEIGGQVLSSYDTDWERYVTVYSYSDRGEGDGFVEVETDNPGEDPDECSADAFVRYMTCLDFI